MKEKIVKGSLKKENKGITLVALVITIIVLIILTGIVISMTVGDNGIFTKAREAKRLQITSEAKEKIGTEILAAQVEAIQRNEELEQAQVEDIISKYGTLQDDKDTIILKDNGYDIKLSDIYQGTITTSGSYTEKNLQEQLDKMTEENTKNKTEAENLRTEIESLKADVERQKELLESMSQSGDEKDKKIAELNERVTEIEKEKNDLNSKNNELKNENSALTSKATELATLKETLSKVTASESKILKNYTAYKDGKLITGTMANYAGKTVTASKITKNGENAEITIPQAGYYGTDSKVSVPVSEINSNSERAICYGSGELSTGTYICTMIDKNGVIEAYGPNTMSSEFRTYTGSGTCGQATMIISSIKGGTYELYSNTTNTSINKVTKTVKAGEIIHEITAGTIESFYIIKIK